MKHDINWPGDTLYASDDSDQDIGVFQGNPELVDFPSTSEIFHAVLENAFYANYIANVNGKTLEANEKACKIFGYSSKEMLSLSAKDLYDINTPNQIPYATLRNSRGKAKSVMVGIRKNGDRFPCEVTSLLFFDDNGEKRTINTIQDISKNYSKTFRG